MKSLTFNVSEPASRLPRLTEVMTQMMVELVTVLVVMTMALMLTLRPRVTLAPGQSTLDWGPVWCERCEWGAQHSVPPQCSVPAMGRYSLICHHKEELTKHLSAIHNKMVRTHKNKNIEAHFMHCYCPYCSAWWIFANSMSCDLN